MKVFKTILLTAAALAAVIVFFFAELKPFSKANGVTPLEKAEAAADDGSGESYVLPAEFTVRFLYGDKLYYSERVAEGRTLRADIAPTDSRFLGWVDSRGEYCEVSEVPVYSDTEYTAMIGPALKSVPTGFFPAEQDGLFYPDHILTRSDMARAVYNLLAEPPAEKPYISDIRENALCYKGAEALVAGGFMELTGEKFRPDEPITIEEMRLLLSQIFNGKKLEKLLSGRGDSLTRGEGAVILYELLGGEALAEETVESYFPDVSTHLDCYRAVSITGQPSTVWVKAGERLQPGFLNVDGWLYCIDSDGFFIRNTTVGTLQFGEDGRFTSGSEELDRYVAEKLAQLIKTQTMPRESMLYEAFKYVRDSNLYLKGSYYRVEETGWEIEEALKLFSKGKGNCYSFAAQMWALARGLGYDAKAISGFMSHTYQPHGWVEIEIDGVMYVFDAEQEGLYYRARGEYNVNMFKMTYETASFWSYIRTVEEAAAAGIDGYTADTKPEEAGQEP
ncbi:MAG: transglutaminase domain-containing protein [Oscillospiraceae bacterium]|nr:transglutaminase domain-containing protein [Oscillospiraceae bacterium]